MAGRGSFLDFFSQACSSNPPFPMSDEENGFPPTSILSEGAAGATNSVGGVGGIGFSALDLNSRSTGFADIDAYTEILRPTARSGLPPMSRSAGTPYRPPRPEGGHHLRVPPANRGGRRGGGSGRRGGGSSGRAGGSGRGGAVAQSSGNRHSSGSSGVPVDVDDDDDDDMEADDDEGNLKDGDDNSSDEEAAKRRKILAVLYIAEQMQTQSVLLALRFGTYYVDRFLDKGDYRVAGESGYEWVVRTLGHRTSCYNMFRMHRPVFDKLHNILVQSYGLKSTRKMSSVESLAMFLWMVGAPQSFRQAEDRFVRSMKTISRKFDRVLSCLVKLAVDIIRPADPEFSSVHDRLKCAQWYPLFNNCIGAIDGTHIRVTVPHDKVPQYFSRHGYTSQNVMAVCDFDMRFTFVLGGWPGSVHDMRVFNDANNRFADKYPSPPQGKFYLVDSGYPNRLGYLSPYMGQKYHFQEFHRGAMPRGKKERFNYTHSRLRNVIERSFGVLKNKWRILFHVPSFPMHKQTKIIVACMALHNFIRESHLADLEFDLCDRDENYQPLPHRRRRRRRNEEIPGEPDSEDMNAFRDSVADELYSRHV